MTLELPDDSPIHRLPWIITFGPLDEAEEWEPVVCGPYERPHALALAESVVADEELMAVVEPVLPAVSPDEIRGEIVAARMAAEDEQTPHEDAELYGDYEPILDEDLHDESEEERHAEPLVAPTEAELRAGFRRIATMLTGIERGDGGATGTGADTRSGAGDLEQSTPGPGGTGS